jgi:hypothetical protein
MAEPKTAAADSIDWNYPGLAAYVNAMQAWFYPNLHRARQTALTDMPDGPDGKWRLCLGVLVFGSYVERFLQLTVPSLLAPGNVRALPDPLVIVHTDAANVETLRVGLAALAEIARVEIHTVPQEILDKVGENPANKYWILGAAHNLHMQQAKYRGCAYHMLMPDHIYGAGFFANLSRLREEGKQAIVQGGLSARLEAVGPLLEAIGGAISPRKLTRLALDNLHSQMTPFIMNGRVDWPSSLLLVMIGKSAVHMVCPHMSIVYLSHEVLMRAPTRLFNTIDGQLPWFIPDDVDAYVPGPDDEMVYVEVSDDDKPVYYANEGHTIEQFCAHFWGRLHCTRGFERFFNLTTVLPFPDGYRPPIAPMAEDAIGARKDAVRQALADNYDAVFALLPERMRIDPIDWLAQQEKAA